MILPTPPDPLLTRVHRGGTLSEADHRLLALWAADCADHVLPHFEAARQGDTRPRQAVEAARDWAAGGSSTTAAKGAAWHANKAALGLPEPARFAAFAAGQAAVVAHVPAHDLGAAAYALRAAMASVPPTAKEEARQAELAWQLSRLPFYLIDLVRGDMARRNQLCWGVFLP